MKKSDNGIKTYYKGLGYCGFAMGSNSAEVDVKDGKIIRIRPLEYDKKYSKEEFKPWTIEARGKSFKPTMKSLLPPFSLVYKKRTYSPNRVLYPLKRVDFDPDGERNPQNRGKSKFVRISWDRATDIIAKEIKRIHKEYSPLSILCQADGHGDTKVIHGGPHGPQTNLLDLMGGYTCQSRNADSWEGWYWGAKHVWGQHPVGQGNQNNLWIDVANNSQMLLFWGCDQETTPWGWSGQMASRLTFWFRELGIKGIYISPDINYSSAIHADKWIPVLPNTDSALQLAIAYWWLTHNTYDEAYLKTHAHGFDDFKKYVLGEKDGIKKTPEWASPLCGVPVYTIKALAREWAKVPTSIVHGNGGSFIRSTYASEPGRLEVYLLGMQGLGRPGVAQLKMIEWSLFGLESQIPHPTGEFLPSIAAAYRGLKVGAAGEKIIPKTLIPKAILGEYTFDKPLTWYGTTIASIYPEDQFVEYRYPMPEDENGAQIHMLWSDAPCWSTCWNGGNEMSKALRSPQMEFVLFQHPWLENDCLFGDIILPVTTKLEDEDISTDNFGGQFNTLMYEGRCVEPLGESKSDFHCVAEVAKKLGLYEQYTNNKTDIEVIKAGFETSGVQNKITFDEFMEKGYYVIPTKDKWWEAPAGFSEFYRDPENNPLTTPTGLIEYYSTAIAEFFPDDEERAPVAKWIPHGESHQENRACERAKTYPYLIVSNHPRWRVHANLDDVAWLREIETCKMRGKDGYQYEPLWINPVDAKQLGIKHGDIVGIHNERGEVLGGAYITERIIPGAVLQDHGAHIDYIEVGKLDRSGANNLIAPSMTTSKNCAGEVTSGYLVGVRKIDLDELKAKYPEAFARKFSQSSGALKDSWIVDGGK